MSKGEISKSATAQSTNPLPSINKIDPEIIKKR